MTGARRSGGFSLVSAIFLMVVLVILGTSIVTISGVQQTTTAQALQATRANYAARAGVQWVGAQALDSWCPGPSYPMSTSFTLPAPLAGFTVTVECERGARAIVDIIDPRNYFIVDVTATSGTYGTPDYVRRKLRTKLMEEGP
jgi:MSHA biogenesis protein MshP